MDIKQRVMASTIKTVLKQLFKRMGSSSLSLQALRRGMEASAAAMPKPRNVHAESCVLAGVDTLCLSPVKRDALVILHLHGGAFFAGSAQTHYGLCAQLAKQTKASVYVPNYRLAPEHPYPAAIDDCVAVYNTLVQQYGADRVAVVGDSAGGGLALALCQLLQQQQLAQPRALVLLSPFVDLTLSGSSMQYNAVCDPMLTKQALQRGVDAYCAQISAKDARVSPLRGVFAGLPKTLIHVGSEEVLLDDALRTYQYAQQAGVQVTLHQYQGMWHNFHMFDVMQDARQALREIAMFIRGNDFMHS